MCFHTNEFFLNYTKTNYWMSLICLVRNFSICFCCKLFKINEHLPNHCFITTTRVHWKCPIHIYHKLLGKFSWCIIETTFISPDIWTIWNVCLLTEEMYELQCFIVLQFGFNMVFSYPMSEKQGRCKNRGTTVCELPK